MWVYDLETLRFLEVNEAALRAYGYTRDEFLAMRIVDLPPRADVPQLIDLLLGSPERLEHVHEWRHRLKDGQVIDVEVTAHRVPFGGREAAMVLAQDITERKRLAEDLRHRALHDVLTDLPNRVLFGDRLAHSLRTAHRDHEPLALLFMDLDRFKEVNDTLGHQCGDVLLQETARRIRSVLRESDTVARLGGDEFAVLLPTTDSQGAKEAARKILGSLEQPFFLEDLLIPIGASIGIALYPYHGRDADSLIRRADAAMYMAKRARAGYATFVPEHEPALVEWPLAAGA
jgi:diguanylate cyclase (GGDEF)-like protein/PAS domain S-box-containing protein